MAQLSTVQQTMLQQLTLSKNPINMMSLLIGMKQIVLHGANAVRFCFDGSKWCHLRYDETSDLYQMEFYRIDRSTFELKVSKSLDGLYGDQLKEVFEQHTKLYLSLR